MKILVFSDSHGKLDWMITAVEEERPDRIFFLGDYERDGWDLSRLYPVLPINVVKGNCDWGPGCEECLVQIDEVRFLLTHGHLYGVKTGFARISAAGVRADADMVCFGHTHVPTDRLENGIRLFNPGTIGGPRGQRVTYGVLTVKGKSITGEIKGKDQE